MAAITVVITGAWSFVLLDRTPQWLPWLRWTVLVAAVLGAVAMLLVPYLASFYAPSLAGIRPRPARRRLAVLIAVPLALVTVASLGGPAAYAVETARTSHTGSLPSAGPAGGGLGSPGGGFRGAGGFRVGFPGGNFGGRPGGPGTGGTGTGGTGTGSAGTGGTGTGSTNAAGAGNAAGGQGTGPGSFPGGGFPGGRFPAGGGGGGVGGGGLGGDTQVSSALTALLKKNASQYTWVAATEGSQEAAPLQLATGDAVMAIGGFNGTDPWPTLTWFKEAVARHQIHYYLGRNSQSFGGGSGSSAITAWVASHYKSATVGGVTVYDLTQSR